MNGFGTLWRIRTRRHIRTMRSIQTVIGPGRDMWPRVQETERQSREEARLQARRRVHERRQVC